MRKVSVLFVCMGNICRSPTAQGVFERLVQSYGLEEQFMIDSAGTHAYRVTEPPDLRAQEAARKRGMDLSRQRSRQIEVSELDCFDYVLVMDRTNWKDLQKIVRPEHRERIHLFMKFASRWHTDEVPDPYYGGTNSFERVLDMAEDAAAGLLAHIRRHQLAA